ncbi:HD domain-containing protein [Allobaculum sp. Allo2]|nr:HD domain-containing protein [Allobaculum sp. Allo2]
MREEERFTEYVQNYNPEDSQIRLKIIHTWKVVSAADQIAENLNLSEEEKKLAHLGALFHDIGRFEQVRRFHTFMDAKSVDHAALGAEILAQEDFLNELSNQEKKWSFRPFPFITSFPFPIWIPAFSAFSIRFCGTPTKWTFSGSAQRKIPWIRPAPLYPLSKRRRSRPPFTRRSSRTKR